MKKDLIKFTDKELNKFVGHVRHPVFGILYRYRYKMLNKFLNGPFEKILEIGLGPGLLMPNLAIKCKSLYGIDTHVELDKVEKKLHTDNITNFNLVRANIYNIPFKNGTFDMIVCQSVLEHLTEPVKAIDEIVRVLNKDGKIIMGFPIKNKITKFLFKILGYDDDKIHPSGHNEILRGSLKRLCLKKKICFPDFPGIEKSLYFVGEFIKKK